MKKNQEKTYKDFEIYIHSIIQKFTPILLLQRHIFKVEKRKSSDEGDVIMECKYTYPYLNPTIRYSEKAFKDWENGEDMVPYILHEMIHPITDPFYAKSIERFATHREILDERENLTDLICNIILKSQS